MTFKPGKSGNPSGRPKGQSFVSLVGHTDTVKIAKRIVELALKGDPSKAITTHMLKLCADRLWPALQRTEQTGLGGGPIQHSLERKELARYLTKDELKGIQEAARDILSKSKRDSKTLLN